MQLKLKASEVSQFWKKDVVECKPDRNRPADLAWNRKPDRNQTADLTRNLKSDRSKPSFSGTSIFNRDDNVKTRTANHLNPWFLETVAICTEQKKVYREEPW